VTSQELRSLEEERAQYLQIQKRDKKEMSRLENENGMLKDRVAMNKQQNSASQSMTMVAADKTDKDEQIEDLEKKLSKYDEFIKNLYSFDRFDSFFFEQAASTIAKEKKKKR